MRIPSLAAAAALLAACAATAPTPVPMGEVRVGADSWPIEAVNATTWRVRVDRYPVVCARPTEEACYWSARHYLRSQELPDVLD